MTNKLSIGKITKDIEEATITFCDNGYLISISGRDEDENWQTTKLICDELEYLVLVFEDVRKIRGTN